MVSHTHLPVDKPWTWNLKIWKLQSSYVPAWVTDQSLFFPELPLLQPLWRPCCDKHTWSLCPVPDTLHLKPLEFWNDEGLTYANELTGGWVPLGSLRIGCGHQKDHGKISELQFSALPGPQCPGRVEGLEVELSTRGQWFNQSIIAEQWTSSIVLFSRSVVYNPLKGQGSTQLLGWQRRS